MIFRKLFGIEPEAPPPAELPVVRNVTVGRSVRLDPLAWRRLEGTAFDLGRDTLDIVAQGRIRLDDGSHVHRFYTSDDVLLQAVSELPDGSDADDFTIFHPYATRYPADRSVQAAFLAALRKYRWTEEGLPPFERFWYPGDTSDQEPVALWEDVYEDRSGEPVSSIRQTCMLYARHLEPEGSELLLALAMQPQGGDLTHEIMIGLPLLPAEFTA